jgi:hypothetical protein
MAKKPKRCPFCRGQSSPDKEHYGWTVHCHDCLAEGPVCETESEAVAAWNNRVLPDRGALHALLNDIIARDRSACVPLLTRQQLANRILALLEKDLI